MNRAPSKAARLVRWLAIAVALYCQACGDSEDSERSATRGSGAHPPAAKAAASSESKEREPLVYKDEDFVESTRNRDPFRSYTAAFKAKGPEGNPQRRVIMPTTAVEEMRLIAIVTGMPRPKAMLVDTGGVGYVVQPGDFIGRPKVIQASGSVAMMLNWRVDRIRENEVVITQQDPGDPTRTALTKIIPLREEVAAR
jgi:type IV pilus assembly protein PilP